MNQFNLSINRLVRSWKLYRHMPPIAGGSRATRKLMPTDANRRLRSLTGPELPEPSMSVNAMLRQLTPTNADWLGRLPLEWYVHLHGSRAGSRPNRLEEHTSELQSP